MKIYQCIHKYKPHIPQFEAKHGIGDDTDISFEELRKLVIEDGYASPYILQPALEGNSDEVFYTLWKVIAMRCFIRSGITSAYNFCGPEKTM